MKSMKNPEEEMHVVRRCLVSIGNKGDAIKTPSRCHLMAKATKSNNISVFQVPDSQETHSWLGEGEWFWHFRKASGVSKHIRVHSPHTLEIPKREMHASLLLASIPGCRLCLLQADTSTGGQGDHYLRWEEVWERLVAAKTKYYALGGSKQ